MRIALQVFGEKYRQLATEKSSSGQIEANLHSRLANEQSLACRGRLNVVPLVLRLVRLVLSSIELGLLLGQRVVHAQYLVVLFLQRNRSGQLPE